MFTGLNTATGRYLLDILGYVALMLACLFHSWFMDGVGIALLLGAHLMGPPGGLAGALTSRVRAWYAYTFAFLYDEDEEDDYPYGRKPWDLADSAYVQSIIRAEQFQGQYEFNFPTAPAYESSYEPCAYRVTPCGRPTNIRAWGDLH